VTLPESWEPVGIVRELEPEVAVIVTDVALEVAFQVRVTLCPAVIVFVLVENTKLRACDTCTEAV
jgi:hypothetical protein